VPLNVYTILTEAAELSGTTLNQLLVQSAFEKAQLIIELARVIKMTRKSAAIFFDALEKPPAPGKKLKKAVKAYKRLKANAKN
jgi:uncharacterized protein (DUF1778 family)